MMGIITSVNRENQHLYKIIKTKRNLSIYHFKIFNKTKNHNQCPAILHSIFGGNITEKIKKNHF